VIDVGNALAQRRREIQITLETLEELRLAE
jgi:hypothetical protein